MRSYERSDRVKREKRPPIELLRCILLHHAVGLSMVLPVNPFFWDLAVYVVRVPISVLRLVLHRF